jgi:hypothetical protein
VTAVRQSGTERTGFNALTLRGPGIYRVAAGSIPAADIRTGHPQPHPAFVGIFHEVWVGHSAVFHHLIINGDLRDLLAQTLKPPILELPVSLINRFLINLAGRGAPVPSAHGPALSCPLQSPPALALTPDTEAAQA